MIEPGPRDVLLVIDVQNGFVPGGTLPVTGGDAVVPLINRLAGRFQHIVLTQDWHTPGHISFASSHPGKKPFETIALPYGPQVLWPDHCVQGTRDADLHPGLDLPRAELGMEQRGGVLVLAALADDRGLAIGLGRRPEGFGGFLREQGAELLAGVHQRRQVVHEATGERVLEHGHRRRLAHRPPGVAAAVAQDLLDDRHQLADLRHDAASSLWNTRPSSSLG